MDLLRNPQPLRNHARTKHNPFDELPAWTGQASVRYGWPLHVLKNAGHFMVAEPPEAFLEALRAAPGNR
jgi:pimeloyl-ACP methyl ester carboxylesterase